MVALLVITFSSLSLRSSVVAWLVVVLGLVVFEGLFLVRLVRVYRVLVPVEDDDTALFVAVSFAGRSID